MALIIGGTRGLGWELAVAAHGLGIRPVVVGRPKREVMPPLKIGDTEVERHEARIETERGAGELMDTFRVNPNIGFPYLFFVAGSRLQGKLVDHFEIYAPEVIATGINGLMNTVGHFHKRKGSPYHLIVVTSTTSYKIKKDETVYGMVKAAQAQFTRNFANELLSQLPGSRVLLVNPAGMKTPFWEGSGVDTSAFLDPRAVADHVWQTIQHQQRGALDPFTELNIERDATGQPVLSYGAKAPM